MRTGHVMLHSVVTSLGRAWDFCGEVDFHARGASNHDAEVIVSGNDVRTTKENVLQDFWLFQASQCARHIYYLNFNTYDIPGHCSIWGDRVNKLTHTAFCKVKGEDWRQLRGDYYNVWGEHEP